MNFLSCSLNSKIEFDNGWNLFWYPFYHIAMTASLYTTLALSIERYRALIVRPIKVVNSYKVLENRTHVLIAAIAICVFSFLLNVPKFFELKFVEVNSTERRHLVLSELYNDYYFVLIYDNIVRNVVLVAVPFVSLTFLNLRIFFALKHRLAAYSGKQRRVEMQTYAVLFGVVLVLATCHSLRIFSIIRLLVSLGNTNVQER